MISFLSVAGDKSSQREMEASYRMLLVFVVINSVICHRSKFDCIHSRCTLQDIASTSDSLEVLRNLMQLTTKRTNYYDFYNETQILSHFHSISCTNVTMETIPSRLFEKFVELEIFTASNVSLEKINQEDFKYATKLKVLDLSRNKILTLNENSFVEINGSLVNLDLSYNKLKIIDEDFILMLSESSSHFNMLNLEGNEIFEIVKSKKVHEKSWSIINVNLNSNKLKAQTNFSVKSLRLDNNEIENLKINDSINLLRVDNNMLRSLDVCAGVVHLSAANNQIVHLNLHNSSVLRILILSGSQIGEEILLKLKSSKNLGYLDLSDTGLTSLSLDSFAEFENFENLNLSKNRIASIEFGVFSHQTSLQHLNLSYNLISDVNLHVFASLSYLESLDISENLISTIDNYESTRKFLRSLDSIGIGGNIWGCQYLAKMYASLKTQYIEIIKGSNLVKSSSNVAGIHCNAHQKDKKNSSVDFGKHENSEPTLREVISNVNQISTRLTKVEGKQASANNNITNLSLVFSHQLQNQMEKLFQDSLNHSGFSWTVFILIILLLCSTVIIGLGVKIYIIPNYRRILEASIERPTMNYSSIVDLHM